MSAMGRVKGWWALCLMAGLGVHPLCAAQTGVISRAVEVAPPAGWTPDTPLFHGESTGSSRDAALGGMKEGGAHATAVDRAARRHERVVGRGDPAVTRTREQRLAKRAAMVKPGTPAPHAAPSPGAERSPRVKAGKGAPLGESRMSKAKGGARASGQAARSAQAGGAAAATRAVAVKRGMERHGARAGGQAASAKRRVPAPQPSATPVARTARAGRAGRVDATALRRSAAPHEQAARAGGKRGALASTASAAKTQAQPAAGRLDGQQARQKARALGGPQRAAKRTPSTSEAGGRAKGAGLKRAGPGPASRPSTRR